MDALSRVVTGCVALARAIGVLAMIVAILVLIGWAAGVATFQSVIAGAVPMKPVTALCFFLTGASLAIHARYLRVSQICASVTVGICALTILEHAFDWDSHFDGLLMTWVRGATAAPTNPRMALLTAVALGAACVSILLLDWDVRGWRPAQFFSLLGALMGLAGALGYLYRVPGALQQDHWATMAVHSALMALLVNVGILLSRPTVGLLAIVNSPLAGGAMARRLLPVALVFPVVIGYLRALGQIHGLFGTNLGILLVACTYIVVFAAGIWITARILNRDAEQEQVSRLRDARLAAIVNFSDDAMIGKTLDGIIASWNRGAEQLYGYSAAEAVGQSISILVPPGREDEVPRFLEQVARGEAISHYETTRRRKDGEIRDVSLTISPIRDAQGRIVGASTVTRDMTDQKAIEASFRAAQERQQEQARILDLAQVLIRGMDGRIGLWSRGSAKLYGFTSEEAVGQISHDLLKTQFPESREHLLQCLQRNGVWEGELTHYTKAGQRIVVASTQVLYYDSGPQPMRILEVNNDITALKNAEASMLQSQKMLAMGTLAAGIAHDFNNVLQAITGNASFAASALPEDHPAQRDIAEIAIAGTRAMGLVRQILAFSRPHAAQHVVTSVRPVVEEALTMLRAALPAMIEIHADLEAVPPISCDPTQVHQVLMNLGTNSGHAMESTGGLLEVSMNHLHVDAEMVRAVPGLWEGSCVHLSVRDSGCGMDRATTARIFDPFFTTKAPNKGTGLGLAVVHGIVKSHGGMVTVESEVGKGTTFHVYLPAMDNVPAGPAPAPRSRVPRGLGQRVLVIDDEKAVASLVSRMLTRLNYQVTTCTEASDAKQEFRSNPEGFAAVVSDLALRGMSGLDLAQEFLEVRGLPIVLMSGYFSAEDRLRAETLGVRRFLQKPTTLAEIGEALHEVLGRRPSPQESVVRQGGKNGDDGKNGSYGTYGTL
jgi:PAS domain S-box-containing protein